MYKITNTAMQAAFANISERMDYSKELTEAKHGATSPVCDFFSPPGDSMINCQRCYGKTDVFRNVGNETHLVEVGSFVSGLCPERNSQCFSIQRDFGLFYVSDFAGINWEGHFLLQHDYSQERKAA